MSELEIRGLNDDFEKKDSVHIRYLEQVLMYIFDCIDVNLSKEVVGLIYEFCQCVYIHTQDGRQFVIDRRALGLSRVLTDLVNPLELIHLKEDFSGELLSHVVKYLEHHNGVEPATIAKPIRSVILSRIVEDEWDADFANSLSKRDTFKVIKFSHKIDLTSLVHLLAAKIATLIKGMSPEEIKLFLSEESEETNQQNTVEVIERKECSLEGSEESKDRGMKSRREPTCMCGYVWDNSYQKQETITE